MIVYLCEMQMSGKMNQGLLFLSECKFAKEQKVQCRIKTIYC